MRAPAGRPFCVYAQSLDGVVFYVGRGNEKRPTSRRDRSERWHAKVGEREFAVRIMGWYATHVEVINAEARAIKRLKPECNVQHHDTNMRAVVEEREAKLFAVRQAGMTGVRMGMVVPPAPRRRYN